LSGAAGVHVADLLAALRSFDDAAFDEGPHEDPFALMPRRVFASLGRSIRDLRFVRGHFFHGSRVVDPDVFFRRGILPLARIIDEIWDVLYRLVETDCPKDKWDSFRRDMESQGCGDSGDIYRERLRHPLHHGPDSYLIRDALLRPDAAWHDYLKIPEIVQDITRCYGKDLEARFRAATVACIVEFEGPIDSPETAANTACWYLLDVVRGDRTSAEHLGWGPSLHGIAVTPESVIAVKTVRGESSPG
jgi:hypothetical protein